MANQTITQLPTAGAITGTELVPIVQNGQTVKTTASALAGSPVQTQTFLTLNQEPTLNNSRRLAGSNGLTLTDNGAQSTLVLALTGNAASLNLMGTGIAVSTASGTMVARSIAVTGNGMAVTDGNGIAGNPTLALSGMALSLASLSGSGIVSGSGAIANYVTITGISNQTSVTNGNGAAGNPTIGLADNPILPGTGSVTVPQGTGAQQPVGADGQIRFNTTTSTFDGYSAGSWRQFSVAGGVTSFSGGSTGFLPSTPTSGAISLTGTLVVGYGGTGATTLTGYVYGNGTSAMTASTTIPTTDLSGTVTNAQLANSSISINGSSVSLGGSVTVTATATNALTIGTGLSGTSYNGSSAVTIAIDSTVATLTGTQTLTNKSISGSTNTLSNIGNASLTNSSLTVGTTAISLGSSSLTLGGLTTVTVTQDPTAALDLATKQYVDAVAQGLDPKASCVAATTANITLSGTQTIDGVALIAGDRCLVKDQTLSQNNGIYLVAAGAWTRAADMDSWLEVPGAFTFIEQGTLYADTGWVCTSNAGGTLGTTPITWVQFAGVGSYTAGTGLTLVGTQFSLTAPVTVALGGTNATNATDARTNLVAAKSGTNSDITELYALNGTSYGVAYQNLANQLTMGSALTFDGTMLFVPGGISGGTF
jgi:hypothetical protein